MSSVRTLATALSLAVALVWGSARPANADAVDDLGRQLVRIEASVTQVLQGLEAPRALREKKEDMIERRFIQAQVAYKLGGQHYDEAAISLYELVEKYPKSRIYPDAVFYLADSLYKKQDYLSARDYFKKVVYEFGETGKHYQQALQRLIELSLQMDDRSTVPDYLARLDKIPQYTRLDSAPYVRGKYAYFSKNFDEAIRVFETINQSSKYFFQAQYFLGASHVAKGELASAARVFNGLLALKAETKEQERVLELAHLALGRIHYERDQMAEAIDHYNAIARKSRLFDEMLYEVAWVYVKNKQFDRALRSLDLLAIANQKSAMLPDVRILEGNLRIRKAQALTAEGTGNSAEEYAKALQVFAVTRDAYQKPREELEALMAAHADPMRFFAQITGEFIEAFDTDIKLPSVAAEWVRSERQVERVVTTTSNLAKVRAELEETAHLLGRVERAVESPARVQIFPDLAERRIQVQENAEQVQKIRQKLATQEQAFVSKYLGPEERQELERLKQRRTELVEKLSSMPNSGESVTERVRKAREAYQEKDKEAQQVEVFITGVEAEIAAVETFYKSNEDKRKVPLEEYNATMEDLRAAIAELRVELSAIRHEMALAMDEAGIGDDQARAEMGTRTSLNEAVRQEQDFMGKLRSRMDGKDRDKAEQIASLVDHIGRIEGKIERSNRKIDELVDGQLADVKVMLNEEKIRLGEYQRHLQEYLGENRAVGSQIIFDAFSAVSSKFYEIAVRADLGVVDVAWAQKEEAKDQVNRMTLDSSREKKMLIEEFRDSADSGSEGVNGAP
ncbi:MAG: tetratricopeptide repeat protein [Deltaproteobacteria bacterium]|nr:tetratricopeptide repeat protein [Deltaproteobacteria bacterium]